MAFVCIPKAISNKLLAAAKSGKFNVQQLTELTSEERRALFAEYAGAGTGKEINALFEKALLSQQKTALKTWAETVFGKKEKATPRYKGVMKAINSLDELGVLNPAEAESFMQDLVAERLGVTISAEEAQQISERAAKLEELSQKGVDEFGLPNMEYLKERRAMFDYLGSLAPSSRLRILTSTIGRGNMLFSIKSPLTNLIGNTVMGIQQAMERRLSSRQLKGTNGEYAKAYFKRANKIFKETGYDVTRMLHLDDETKTLGEENIQSQGEGKVRRVGRFYEDHVFKQLLAAPDVAYSAAHFADSANLGSTKIAQQEGLQGKAAQERALEVFKDATSLDPQTDEGKLIRAQAIADAMYATYQNDSNYSTLALAIRKLFNTFSGDLRLGDQLMPFVKTPANVIGAGLDASGISAIRAVWNIKGALEAAKLGDREPMKQVVRDFVRSGLGLTLAFAVSAMFDPDDFIGEYPTSPKEQELLRLQRATPNSVRIGDRWISLDYFGAIGAPLVGIMYARKYGDGLVDTVYQYGKGVGVQSLKIPGFDSLYDTIKAFKDAVPQQEDKPATEKGKEALGSIAVTLADFISARTIPSIVYDIGKATDATERKYDTKNAAERVQAKVPFLRNSLPAREDVFGEEVKTENPISVFLFGARVKKANEAKVVEEMVRLQEAGNLPSLTDVEKTSGRVKEFKNQVSQDKYEKALSEFRDNFGKRTVTLTNSFTYRRADDEKKAELINKAKAEALDAMLEKYRYKKPKK